MRIKRNCAVWQAAALLLAVVAASPAAGVQRAFVSATSGDDANVATSCSATAPCRSFAQAVTVVDSGGEVVALTSGAYGAVTLTSSISLVSAPGVYAGITVYGGANGVTIAVPGISVVLRGLTINSMGGVAGVYMSDGSRLSVENCVISNFAGGYGVYVATPGVLRVVDTRIRASSYGAFLQAGATAVISRSGFHGNGYGIYLSGAMPGVTTAAVSETTVSASSSAGISVLAWLSAATARADLSRVSVVNGDGEGLLAQASSGGSASVTMSDSLVSGNATGVYQSAPGVVRSTGNNAIVGNRVDLAGGLTAIAPM